MTSALHQITMSFSTEEDRMLLRVGTTDKTEYQFWLTRRFVRVLWSALTQTLENEPGLKAGLQAKTKKVVVAMEHQEAVGAADFSHRHEEDYEDMTGQTGPLLIVGGSVKPGKKGASQLIFQTRGGPDVNLMLNKKLSHALCKLLVETSKKAGWNLNLVVGDAASLVVPEDKTQVH